jgi:hypothetical protein
MPKAVTPQKSQRLKCLLTNSADSGWHFLIVKKAVVKKFGFEDKFRRVMCSIEGSEAFHCALLPSRDEFYIIVNKKRREALGLVAGKRFDVLLEKDESEYGLPMPEEVREVLNQDPEGDRLFHELTPGKQRSMLYWLSRTKDVDRRIHETLIFMEHLKNNDGKIDNKKLQQELKRPAY